MLTCFAEALRDLPVETAAKYRDYAESCFSDSARKLLEEIVTTGYEYTSETALHYIAEGEARGEAKSVLLVLAARDIDVPAGVRERITSCTDTAQLDLWVRRAAIVESADRLFD